jgi:hypothetical protein
MSKPKRALILSWGTAWMGLVALAGGCTAGGSPPRATDVVASITPADTQPATVTDTRKPSPTGTATPTLKPTPTPISFSQPQDERHRLIFANTTEEDQTIYGYDYETGELLPLFVFPPEMSLHQQPEVWGPGQSSELVPLSRPKGIQWDWMFFSPDGRTLATLQPAFGGYPNYLHQIDLLTKEVVSLKLMENYEWAIPVVPGRRPHLFYGIREGYEPAITILGMFHQFVWSPGSESFVFTIGNDLDPPSQLYYGRRMSPDVHPIAVNSPGLDIGLWPQWSPDGKYIVYIRDTSGNGIWLVDIKSPETSIQIWEGQNVGLMLWSKDSGVLFFSVTDRASNGRGVALLYALEIKTEQATNLLRIEFSADEDIVLYPQAEVMNGQGLIIAEYHFSEDGRLPGRSLYLSLETGRITPIVENEEIPQIDVSPSGLRALATSGEPCKGAIIELSSVEKIFEPQAELCMGGYWSPDGRLVAGFPHDIGRIFDLETGELTYMAQDLEGTKYPLGWMEMPEE